MAAAPDQAATEEICDWLVSDYVIRYLTAGDRVVALRVKHGKERRPA